MTKKELRTKYKAERQKLSKKEIDNFSIDIANQLLKIPIWDSSYYHLFLSIKSKNEINTEYILNILYGKDKHVIVSKSDFNTNTLKNYLLGDNTIIKTNHWGIPEPVDGIEIDNSKIEVVFVPLLAFDINGHRVGYGKGFYDTFLSKCSLKTIKVGLSFFEAETEINDIYEGDIILNFCVTPFKIYNFLEKS